jgi:hypothetical protein
MTPAHRATATPRMPRRLVALIAALVLGIGLDAPAYAVAPTEPTAVRPVTAALPVATPTALITPLTIRPMTYQAEADFLLNRARTRFRVRSTLTITAPSEGMDALTIAVAARAFGAWSDRALRVDGIEVPFTYDAPGGMALRLDLTAAPWEGGSVHEVIVEGVIIPGRSRNTQGLLRRFGSGRSLVITMGDMLPLPMERPRSVVFADPLSAPAAESIRATIRSASDLPAAGVIAGGELIDGPTSGVGRSWTYLIAPARSFSFLIAPGYGRNSATLELPDVDGALRTMTITAHGPTRAGRRADLATATAAVRALWSRFGPGPYFRLAVVSIPSVNFAHEFPGLVTVGGTFTGAWRRHVVRHEVAHQWWQTMVATDQGRDPWMDETIAEWTAQRLAGATRATQRTTCARPIDGPSYRATGYYRTLFGAGQFFDCVYLRGPRLFYAVGDVVGDARLEACLATYAQANRFGSPAPAVLIGALRGCAETDSERAAVEAAIATYLTPATLAE